MNDASTSTKSTRSGKLSRVRWRALTPSRAITRGSLRKRRMQLAVPDVDRVHARSATRKRAVGEAARRCADVGDHQAAQIDAQIVERARELESAARDVRMVELAEREHHAAPSNSSLARVDRRAVAHGPCQLRSARARVCGSGASPRSTSSLSTRSRFTSRAELMRRSERDVVIAAAVELRSALEPASHHRHRRRRHRRHRRRRHRRSRHRRRRRQPPPPP